MRNSMLTAVFAMFAISVGAGPSAEAAESTPSSYLRVVPMSEKDCSGQWVQLWTVLGGPCVPGALSIGITNDAFKNFRFADLYRVDKVKNDRKFCKGLKGDRAKKCRNGSHYTRIRIPTTNVCDYESVKDWKGNFQQVCAVSRHMPRSGSLEPGNYIFNLYKDSPGKWQCSIYYEEVCRWSSGYSISGDILFTWDGSQVLSERVIDEIFL